MLPFSVCILAGGGSTRMGRDKAGLVFEGRTLLERQVALAWALGPSEVFVAGRTGTPADGMPARVLPDARVGLGPLMGVAAALRAASTPHVLMLAVDMPALTAAFLSRVLERRLPAVGVAPRSARGWEPMIGVYPVSLAASVEASLAAHQLGLGQFISQAVADGALREYRLAAADHPALSNWNSPEDVVAELIDRVALAKHRGIAPERDAAWGDVAARRSVELDSGQATFVPGD